MDQKDGIWMNHFILDGRYEDLLSHYKFNVEEALKKKPIFLKIVSKKTPSFNEWTTILQFYGGYWWSD